MKLYEILYIIKNDYTDEEIPRIIKKVLRSLHTHAPGSVIKHTEELGRKRLSYPINKNVNGYYGLIDIETEPKYLPKLNREFELDDNLVRHLIISKRVKSKDQLQREAILREKAQKAQETKREEVKKVSRSTKGMVQKKEELPQKESKEKTVHELEEKLDEILKRDIVE